MSRMSVPKTIIVTGANRGIGQAICRLLLSDVSRSSTTSPSVSQPNFRLLATSRNPQSLSQSLHLSDNDKSIQLLYPHLDISSPSSITEFTSYIRNEIKSVHALINNAGVNLETGQMQHVPQGSAGAAERYALARKTLDVNYFGTKNLTLALLPFLNPYQDQAPRIVNLSSVASSLAPYSSAIQSRFRSPDNGIADLDLIAEDYLENVRSDTEEEHGYSLPGRSYNVSKALINALTSIIARQNSHILVNSCCPGWIATDMGGLIGTGRMKPPKTPEEGAKIPVNLALGNIDQTSGEYWANASVRSKDKGSIQRW